MKFLKGLTLLLTVAVIANVLVYAGFNTNVALLSAKSSDLKQNAFYMWMFYQHIFAGSIALIMGVIQLIFTLKKMRAHKHIGRLYVFGVALSGVSGTYIAIYANTGFMAQLGFFLLGILWLFTTSKALYHILKGNRELHRQWITRSMALTFAAITLRIWLPMGLMSGLDFNTVYPYIAWLCWVPNLLVAELFFVNTIKIRRSLQH
ncbi:MAG: DUF2306 domain-containing protein [Balneolaceae bacterium]